MIRADVIVGIRNAFYGLHGRAGFHTFRDWLLSRLNDFANLPPETANSQLRGLFLSADREGETVQWLVRNRQVLTVPDDPHQQPTTNSPDGSAVHPGLLSAG